MNDRIDDTAHYRTLDAAHHIHPFSDMGALNRAGSHVIVRADGVYLWDSEGRRIVDGMAGLWCVNVGYGRRELAEATFAQMNMLPYYNTFFKTTHPPVIELSALLAELTSFERFLYCNSGSEANDTALRVVHRYWALQGKRDKRYVIARKNAYHGSTIAGTTLGGMDYMHEQMPSPVEMPSPVAHVAHIDQPYWYGEGGAASVEDFGIERARQLEAKILELGADHVAAFIDEPFQGAGGMIFPPPGYWREIEALFRADAWARGRGRRGFGRGKGGGLFVGVERGHVVCLRVSMVCPSKRIRRASPRPCREYALLSSDAEHQTSFNPLRSRP